MKKIIIVLLFACLGLASAWTVQAKALLEMNYPVIGGKSLTEESVSEESGLLNYINYIYTLILSLVGIAAVGALVYGGFVYMLSESIFDKKVAMEWIWGAVSGLILALSSYLILRLINPELVKLKIPGPASEASSQQSSAPMTAHGYPVGTTPPISPASTAPAEAEEPAVNPELVMSKEDFKEIWEEDNRIKQELEGAGINTKDICAQGQSVDCVRLSGLQESTLEGLKAFKNECPTCDMTVTGAMEWGQHSNECHTTTGTCVDLRSHSSITHFFTSESEVINERTWTNIYGGQEYTVKGQTYKETPLASESGKTYSARPTWEYIPELPQQSHWHIEFE